MCSGCQSTSTIEEDFCELSLPIRNVKSVDKCLDQYFKQGSVRFSRRADFPSLSAIAPLPENLRGANQYACLRCRGKRDAVKFTKLQKLPAILNIQLSRFSYDPEVWR